MAQELNRDALIIYLRDLRNLEVVKSEIETQIDNGATQLDDTVASIKRQQISSTLSLPSKPKMQYPKYIEKPQPPQGIGPEPTKPGFKVAQMGCGSIVALIFSVICFPMGLYFVSYFVTGGTPNSENTGFMLFCLLFPIITWCVLFVAPNSEPNSRYKHAHARWEQNRILYNSAMGQYKKACQEYEEELRADEEEREANYNAALQRYKTECQEIEAKNSRTATLASQAQANAKQEWIQEREQLESQKQAVDTWLDKAYGLNIIPLQYRNLAAISYIYDNMSSSMYVTLETVLYHTHMEEGITRLEQGLDRVVQVAIANIDETRKLREQNSVYAEQQLAKETAMLESLERAELAAAGIASGLDNTNEALGRLETTVGNVASAAQLSAANNAEIYREIKELHGDLQRHDYGRSEVYTYNYYYTS